MGLLQIVERQQNSRTHLDTILSTQSSEDQTQESIHTTKHRCLARHSYIGHLIAIEINVR